MVLKLRAVLFEETFPVKFTWDRRWFVEGRAGLLVVHFEEKEIRELFDVIAVTDAVVPKDVAVVPEPLDDG